MFAEDVYNQNVNKVRQLTDKGRKGIGASELIPDKALLIQNGMGYQEYKIAHDMFKRVVRIGDQLLCVGTNCEVTPINHTEIEMECEERNEKETRDLCNCLKPVKKEIKSRIIEIMKEANELNKILRASTREEKRLYDKLLIPIEQKVNQLENNFNNYKTTHCGAISTNPITKSKIRVKGKEVTKL